MSLGTRYSKIRLSATHNPYHVDIIITCKFYDWRQQFQKDAFFRALSTCLATFFVT